MKRKIILASASPRRRELLTQVGFDFTVMPSDVEENPASTLPQDIVIELSKEKARDVWNRIGQSDCLVISADRRRDPWQTGRRGGCGADVGAAFRKGASGLYRRYACLDRRGGKTEGVFFLCVYKCCDVPHEPGADPYICAKWGAHGQGRRLRRAGEGGSFYQSDQRRVQQCGRPAGGKALSGDESLGTSVRFGGR